MAHDERSLPVETGDGHRFELIDIGREGDPTVLFVPGMGISARNLIPLGKALEPLGVRLLIHEWRGNGASSLRARRGVDWGYDDLLDRELEVPTELVVLSVGMRPSPRATSKFHDMLKASLGLDGFFLERHPELAPVETAVEGVLVAGMDHTQLANVAAGLVRIWCQKRSDLSNRVCKGLRCRDEFFRPDLSSQKMHSDWFEMKPRDITQRAGKLLEKRLTEYEKPEIDPHLEKDLVQYVRKRKHSI